MSTPTLFGTGLLILGLVVMAGIAIKKYQYRHSPYRFKAKDILTPNETEFFGRIRQAVPELLVMTQVSMGALMTGTHESGKHIRARMKFAQKIVDFVILDKDCNVVLLIELDDRMHNKGKDRERDAMTRQAGYATLRFESRNKPSVPALRAAILKQIRPR